MILYTTEVKLMSIISYVSFIAGLKIGRIIPVFQSIISVAGYIK